MQDLAELNQAKLNQSKLNQATQNRTKQTQASFRALLFVAVACMALCLPAWAQKDAGSIVGAVKDQTGASVANAKVTVTDTERGTHQETTTNDSGEYVVSPLRVGHYTVTVEHPGFKKAVTVPISLDVQQRIAMMSPLRWARFRSRLKLPELHSAPGN